MTIHDVGSVPRETYPSYSRRILFPSSCSRDKSHPHFQRQEIDTLASEGSGVARSGESGVNASDRWFDVCSSPSSSATARGLPYCAWYPWYRGGETSFTYVILDDRVNRLRRSNVRVVFTQRRTLCEPSLPTLQRPIKVPIQAAPIHERVSKMTPPRSFVDIGEDRSVHIVLFRVIVDLP